MINGGAPRQLSSRCSTRGPEPPSLPSLSPLRGGPDPGRRRSLCLREAQRLRARAAGGATHGGCRPPRCLPPRSSRPTALGRRRVRQTRIFLGRFGRGRRREVQRVRDPLDSPACELARDPSPGPPRPGPPSAALPSESPSARSSSRRPRGKRSDQLKLCGSCPRAQLAPDPRSRPPARRALRDLGLRGAGGSLACPGARPCGRGPRMLPGGACVRGRSRSRRAVPLARLTSPHAPLAAISSPRV